ncbi:MAG: GDSL-type esterase/lipase family protein [Clostridia bacterium]|nr:GDSL-type esterase/lipase family protein [Clostridia bacterium]
MKKVLSFVLCIMMLTMSFNIIIFADEEENLAAEVMTKEVFEASNGISMPYRLYVPDDYSAEKEYSFLLFLHGAGNRGNDNESQVSVNTGLINRIISGETIIANGQTIDSSKEFIIVAPQCATEFQWVDTSWSVIPDPSYKLDEIPQSKYMTAVVELIDSMKVKYNLNSSRMYATGLSMGGFGTWDLLMRYPDLFAAAIPMGGAGDTSKADVIKNTPVWTFHQLHDPVVASDGTVAMVKALIDAGAEVKFTPYFDTVHNAWTKGYAEPELLQWLYNHTKETKKIAFVGDSITYGAGVANRDTDAFASIIKAQYGDKYEISNFGVSATSALKTAKQPYVDKDQYKASLEFEPDILFIMLGTNDIKYENWDEGKDNFVADYVELINSYRMIKPSLKIYIGIPPRIFKENVFGERSPEILEKEGIPAVYKVIEEVGATPVDFFTPTMDSPELFPDFLHPAEEGNKVFAKIVEEVMFAPADETVIPVTDGASDWAKDEIALAYASEIMPATLIGGYTADITRKEFCQMVVNMLPENLEASRTASFDDCDDDAVGYAYSVGVVNGMSDKEFAPDNKATREEMAAMLYRAFKLVAPEAVVSAVGEYPDSESISDWAKESVDFLNENKIMNGDEAGRINPQANTSREESILLVYRAYCAAYYYGNK